MVMGRLKPGVTMAQAQGSVNLQLQQFLTEQAGSQLTDERSAVFKTRTSELVEGKGGISGLRSALLETVAHADGDRRHGAVDRVRERRQSAAVARRCAQS